MYQSLSPERRWLAWLRVRSAGDRLSPIGLIVTLGAGVAATLVLAFTLMGILRVPAGAIDLRGQITPRERIPSPVASPSSLVWMPDNTLVVGSMKDQVWYRAPGARDWQQLSDLDLRAPCLGVSTLRSLPDGRLGLVNVCAGTFRRPWGMTYNLKPQLQAYDFKTNRRADLLPYELPFFGTYAWSPDMRRGIVSTIRAFGTLYWLDPSASEPTPVPITLTDGSHSWYLPNSVNALMDYDRPDHDPRAPSPVGKVGPVSWSPDGKRIAFWATLNPIGKMPDLNRADPWTLYTLDVATLKTEVILQGIYDPNSLLWSHDGQWLVYTVSDRDGQLPGIRMVALSDQQQRLVQEGSYQGLAWSPDGATLAAIRCESGLLCEQSKIELYDLGSVMRNIAVAAQGAPEQT